MHPPAVSFTAAILDMGRNVTIAFLVEVTCSMKFGIIFASTGALEQLSALMSCKKLAAATAAALALGGIVYLQVSENEMQFGVGPYFLTLSSSCCWV